ncbi:MAG: hypothetical protein JSW15_07810 [Deltaproteobacteria bacterium]|nr:MAG: hypothetical protein JSW15_07810 [Deltaproteobacteria bacterium]
MLPHESTRAQSRYAPGIRVIVKKLWLVLLAAGRKQNFLTWVNVLAFGYIAEAT